MMKECGSKVVVAFLNAVSKFNDPAKLPVQVNAAGALPAAVEIRSLPVGKPFSTKLNAKRLSRTGGKHLVKIWCFNCKPVQDVIEIDAGKTESQSMNVEFQPLRADVPSVVVFIPDSDLEKKTETIGRIAADR